MINHKCFVPQRIIDRRPGGLVGIGSNKVAQVSGLLRETPRGFKKFSSKNSLKITNFHKNLKSEQLFRISAFFCKNFEENNRNISIFG